MIALEVAANHIDAYLTWGSHTCSRRGSMGAANKPIEFVDDETIAKPQKMFSRMDSEGQRLMSNLHNGDRTKLEVSLNLWAGVGLVRTGSGTALVEHQIQWHCACKNMLTLALSGYPHLEEAYTVAELSFPKLSINQKDNSNYKTFFSPFGGDIKQPATK